MLEDLELFMAVEVVVEEEGAKEVCLTRSWSPDLGSPTLVAPAFIMAARQQTTPESPKSKQEGKSLYNKFLNGYPQEKQHHYCVCVLTAVHQNRLCEEILPKQMLSMV